MIVDVVGDFIKGLSYSVNVLSTFYNSSTDNTLLYVDDLLHVRKGNVVTIDDLPYPVIDVNDYLKRIEVPSDVSTATKVGMPKPYYKHGTPYAANKEIDLEVQFPLAYFLEITEETVPNNPDSAIASIGSVRLFLLDDADSDNWDTAQHYDEDVRRMRKLSDYILSAMQNNRKLFGLPTNIKTVAYSRFGEYVNERGMLSSIFNKKLSGVELRLDLPVKKVNTCKP